MNTFFNRYQNFASDIKHDAGREVAQNQEQARAKAGITFAATALADTILNTDFTGKSGAEIAEIINKSVEHTGVKLSHSMVATIMQEIQTGGAHETLKFSHLPSPKLKEFFGHKFQQKKNHDIPEFYNQNTKPKMAPLPFKPAKPNPLDDRGFEHKIPKEKFHSFPSLPKPEKPTPLATGYSQPTIVYSERILNAVDSACRVKASRCE